MVAKDVVYDLREIEEQIVADNTDGAQRAIQTLINLIGAEDTLVAGVRESVSEACVGYFMGHLTLFTAECGARVEVHHTFCHQCGARLVFPQR